MQLLICVLSISSNRDPDCLIHECTNNSSNLHESPNNSSRNRSAQKSPVQAYSCCWNYLNKAGKPPLIYRPLSLQNQKQLRWDYLTGTPDGNIILTPWSPQHSVRQFAWRYLKYR